MPSEIVLKMPQRTSSALGIALCVVLALCLTPPSRARACGVPTFDGDAMMFCALGLTLGTSWVVFTAMDIDAASDGRPLASGAATVEMLLPGLASLVTGAGLLDSRSSGFAATSMLAGTWFTLHGGYALMHSGGERATDMPEPARSRAPRPMPGHFNVAVNPDPRSPHATFSVTF
jgi:hypothetical protein